MSQFPASNWFVGEWKAVWQPELAEREARTSGPGSRPRELITASAKNGKALGYAQRPCPRKPVPGALPREPGRHFRLQRSEVISEHLRAQLA